MPIDVDDVNALLMKVVPESPSKIASDEPAQPLRVPLALSADALFAWK